jgi:sialate O-acetylesterase
MVPRPFPRLRRISATLLWLSALIFAEWLAILTPEAAAAAQQPGAERKDAAKKSDGKNDDQKKPPEPSQREPLNVVEPVYGRVYQRGPGDRADIPIVFDQALPADAIHSVEAFLEGTETPARLGAYRGGKLCGIPAGGPYRIRVMFRDNLANFDLPHREGELYPELSIPDVYVGDLWVLAGQSNMEGVGDLLDVTPPSEHVQLLGMNGRWGQAEEPLHWLVDSPDPVHSGNPADREQRSEAQHRSRIKGAGLGLPFGVIMAETTKVPVGLIACAHGGTSMSQWDPAKKAEGGNSLYGSMLRQVRLAGGKVRGVLWYQGESDAMNGAAKEYPKVFADFIGSVRNDLGQPDLPFYLVQIGRFVVNRDPKEWNAVQEAQRQIPNRVPNTATIASVDLELDDLIHVGTQGLKRLGARLARVALREQFGQIGASTPTLDHVARPSDNTLVVRFKGVNRALAPPKSAPRAEALAGLNHSIRLNAPREAPALLQPVPGLQPLRHIAGFSIRKADGSEIPLVYEAAVGPLGDAVVLKLAGALPSGAFLWYGYGLDPYCNLTDALDMAVPVFGPIALDDLK